MTSPTAEESQLPQLQSQKPQHRCGPHRECILIFMSWNAICGFMPSSKPTFISSGPETCLSVHHSRQEWCVLGQGYLVELQAPVCSLLSERARHKKQGPCGEMTLRCHRRDCIVSRDRVDGAVHSPFQGHVLQLSCLEGLPRSRASPSGVSTAHLVQKAAQEGSPNNPPWKCQLLCMVAPG